ncbi:unnamed protein product [Polarella glacialis]|uniref:DM10 domain-containing protein n=1 Tax=Polarella glacialis TaxID=89957 RepID=A0A813JJF7_POLGL|nr:unnamed protein product [Polarella glacialis]
MGFDQASMQIEQPQLVHRKLTFPPHNGFGSDEDSLASCLRLTPRPPRRDVKKLLVDADKVLRFEAEMVNEKPEDENRRFIVAIYLADHSVAVWELKQRNSGHSEGKFAAKSKKQNAATGHEFVPSDFFVGAILEVNASPFLLTGVDEAALLYMEEHMDDFPYADVTTICSKLIRMKKYLKEAQNELMPIANFHRLAEDVANVTLVEHELISLARAFGSYTTDPERPVESAIELAALLQGLY